MKKPLDNFDNLKTTYEFGDKTHYNDFHLGLDIVVPTGTPLYASDDGIVETGKSEIAGVTIYFLPDSRSVVERHIHLYSIVKTGRVEEGDLIGYTGNTGMSTQPHLHTDIWKDGYKYQEIVDQDGNVIPEKARELLIDPEVYYNSKKVKCRVLSSTGKHTQELSFVRDWYFYMGDIEIEFDEVKVEHDLEWKYNEHRDDNRIDLDDWKIKRGHHANGVDMVVNCMSEENYLDSDSLGYMKSYRVLGRYISFQMDREEERSRSNGWANNSQFAGTLRHELAHKFHRMGGFIDKTHEKDYGDGLENMFDYMDADDLKPRPPKMVYRKLYKYTNRTERPKYWEPKFGKLYKDTAGRFFLEYNRYGWEMLTEDVFEEKLKQKGGKCVVLSLGESNWIAKNKVGVNLEEQFNRGRTIIERNVSRNLWERISNTVSGFSHKIPK